jgi:hypothetical protein
LIGLRIEVENRIDNYLFKLFDGIDMLRYTWEIRDEEILYEGDIKNERKLFGAHVLDGETFHKCLSRNQYYMVFADIRAYPITGKRIEINTYTEYLESDCEMILLCVDAGFIDFYCKNKEVMEIAHNNCCLYQFDQVEIITEENDSRTRMSVW